MERLKFSIDDESYSTSRGRWCKYFFNQNNKDALMIIGETDDYFYFTISVRDGMLKDKYCIKLNQGSVMYEPMSKLLSGFETIDVFEEGSPERKSLCFAKCKNGIKITFNLTDEERVFYTIEFANLRRLGDTRFKNLVVEGDKKLDVEIERDFRYKFKVRLHKLLDELNDMYASKQQNNQQK